MTQTRDLIKKMADFFTSEDFYEKGEDARLELSPDDVRCMNYLIQRGKFKDRKEQRKVTETMNALLLPLLPHLTSDTAIIVKRTLYLLGEIEIEPQESEDKK